MELLVGQEVERVEMDHLQVVLAHQDKVMQEEIALLQLLVEEVVVLDLLEVLYLQVLVAEVMVAVALHLL
jgi:hypothetical protein